MGMDEVDGGVIAPTRVTSTTVARRRSVARRRRVACAAWPAWRAATASSRSPPASWSCWLLTGAVGALVRSPARPTITAAPLHASVKVPAAAPSTTTTTPAFSSNGGTAQAKNAAPSGAAFGTSSGSASTTTPPSTPNLPNGAVGQSAKIEQTGSLTLTVGRGKLSRTVAQLSALAVSDGGFVANSQTQSGATPSGSVTLQVPVNSFAAVLARAQALGRTSDLTTKATDVTGQYVDLQSRITALQASRQQYLTILAKATTVGDVLAVQEQIDSIQSQIEQLQGQLQLLTSQTSYSTLTVTVSESTPAPPPAPCPSPASCGRGTPASAASSPASRV